MSSFLSIEGVSFFHGTRRILRSVSFNAEGGEFLALLGINGAGKSTLLDLVAGFRKTDSGSIVIAGRDRDLWSLREMAQHISHLPQFVNANLPYTAEQLVAMGRYPHTDRWFESEEDHRLIQEAMERTDSWKFRSRAFAALSGGERQRVLLAACLAQNASTLLLDEPSTFLDIHHQLHCFAVLREEAQRGKLCIAVTHDLNLALTHCTRLIVLADGVVAHDIPASQVHQAQQDRQWLSSFSPRLRIDNTPTGSPWVWYQ